MFVVLLTLDCSIEIVTIVRLLRLRLPQCHRRQPQSKSESQVATFSQHPEYRVKSQFTLHILVKS